MHPGLIIKFLREEKNISRTDLAKKSGLSLSFLNDLERQKKEPTISSLQKICDAFNISLLEFFLLDFTKFDLNRFILRLVSILKTNKKFKTDQLEYLLRFVESNEEIGPRHTMMLFKYSKYEDIDPRSNLNRYIRSFEVLLADIKSLNKFEFLSEAMEYYLKLEKITIESECYIDELKDSPEDFDKKLIKVANSLYTKIAETLTEKLKEYIGAKKEEDSEEIEIVNNCNQSIKEKFGSQKLNSPYYS